MNIAQMRTVLKAAGIYNLLWGAAVVLAPAATLRLFNYPPQPTPELWQCIGMIVGVYGIGYWFAGDAPLRHWPVVLVGFLGKLFGPIGFLNSAWQGKLPWSAGWVNITNDLIWLVPFALILRAAWRAGEMRRGAGDLPAAGATLAAGRSTTPASLAPAGVAPLPSKPLTPIDHLAIPVNDVAAAVDWYRQNFQCEVKYQDATWALLQFGNLPLAFVIPEQHPPHLAFAHPEAEKYGPLKTHRDGTRSCYIRDPAGNAVELMGPSVPRA